MVTDVNRPVLETWFGLGPKALRSGETLPSANAVMLPFETLICILVATRMSMMTRITAGQVLHHRVHPEMLLM